MLPATGAVTPLIPGDSASVGPLALADVDGDGDLDLFVGARIIPGGYPLSPSSRLFRNDGGRLVPDSGNNGLFAGMGMVSAALFSDIDGNGWPDLLVALEWGTDPHLPEPAGPASPRPRPARPLGPVQPLERPRDRRPGRRRPARHRGHQLGPEHRLPRESGRSAVSLFRLLRRRAAVPTCLLAQQDPRIGGVAPLTTFARLGLALPECHATAPDVRGVRRCRHRSRPRLARPEDDPPRRHDHGPHAVPQPGRPIRGAAAASRGAVRAGLLRRDRRFRR